MQNTLICIFVLMLCGTATPSGSVQEGDPRSAATNKTAGKTSSKPAILEMRILATDEYEKERVYFDLAEERKRLLAWMAKPVHKLILEKDLSAIEVYNKASAEHGGPKSSKLRWCPHLIKPNSDHPRRWGFSFALNKGSKIGAVPLYSKEDYRKGPNKEQAYLVELLPVNMHGEHFNQDDLDPASLRVAMVSGGRTCHLRYALKEERKKAYSAWTIKVSGEVYAMIVDGRVVMAFVLRSSTPCRGHISGLTEPEAKKLVKRIQAASTPAAKSQEQGR